MNRVEVSEEVWKEAQIGELRVWKAEPKNSEDWNGWWSNKFENYSSIKHRKFNSILEVGCGPYAKNTMHVLNALETKPSKILLEDPLIEEYVRDGKSVSDYTNATFISSRLEDLNLEEKTDCIVCINVFDHVMSAPMCLQAMYDNLNVGGVLIIGNEVSSQIEDVAVTSRKINEKGTLHPIWFDADYLDRQLLSKYNVVYNRVLPRSEGRCPSDHYGTYLFIGEKK